jgi:2-phospho-L-lactate guanylyltransferase
VNGAVLIPVKDFTKAKARLAGVLSPADRARLAQWMAARVVAAGWPLPVYVVCDDEAVADWATRAGAEVLWRPGHGLNGAATDGVAAIAEAGFDTVIVAHSDLPLAHDLAGLLRPGAAVLVPDRHGDGTNVLAIPTGCGFTFSYGARSFDRHREQAVALGLPVVVEADAGLAVDVDTPDDVRLIGEHLPAWARLAS